MSDPEKVEVPEDLLKTIEELFGPGVEVYSAKLLEIVPNDPETTMKNLSKLHEEMREERARRIERN